MIARARVPQEIHNSSPHRRTVMSSIQFSIATIAFETIAFVVFNTASAAEQPFAAPQVSQHVPVSTAGSLAQVTLSLLLVLAVVFAAAWIVRRIRGFGKFGPNIIQVIADAPLGTKERAVLIQVGGQQLLVGVTAGQVNLLHVLNEPVTPATPSGGGSMDPLRPEFKAILKRSLGLK